MCNPGLFEEVISELQRSMVGEHSRRAAPLSTKVPQQESVGIFKGGQKQGQEGEAADVESQRGLFRRVLRETGGPTRF